MARFFALAALLTACASTEPSVSQLVGPDGARAFHVSCRDAEARCFQLAGETCPSGYDYAATPQGNLLIRCKDAIAPSPYLAFSDPQPSLADNPYVDAGLSPNPYTAPAGSAPGNASFPPLR